MIHGLELPIQAKDLIKGDQTSTHLPASRYVTAKFTSQIFIHSNTITTVERFRSENT